MISAKGATKALFILKAAQLAGANDGQAIVWAELFRDTLPSATDDDLMLAVRNIASSRTSTGRGGAWVTFGDVAEQVRAIRRKQIEDAERRTRQIESHAPVTNIDVGRIMADARKGLSPDEVARRARERAESQALKAAKEEA